MLQERNREMKELHREMSDTFWPRARLLNCLAPCCTAEKKMEKRMSKGGREARKKERKKELNRKHT